MKISGHEYIKFLAEQLTSRLNSPKQSRKQRNIQLSKERTSFTNRWFGILPFAVKTMLTKSK